MRAMLIKDKDILADGPKEESKPAKPKRKSIDKKNMSSAWGDAFDYYLRGITEKYLFFRGRATRLEFWGYLTAGGLALIPLYFLGDYIDMPMLVYYYAMATFIPTVAAIVRRFHDINKKAMIYIALGGVILFSAIFIQYWAFIPLLLWVTVLVKLLSLPTEVNDGLFGEANENDEIYGDDNLPIIRKFRFLALFLIMFWTGFSIVQFDDWSRQVQQKSENERILEQVAELGESAGLTPQQIEEAQDLMRKTLRNWNGQSVQEDDITKEIEKAVQLLQQVK